MEQRLKEPIKILLIEDHTLVRQGFINILNACPEFKVAGEADNAEEALKKLNSISPDIVLMDIGLPGINGIEATTEISKTFPLVKVLILSMRDGEEIVLEAVKAGAKGYILKDTPQEELFKAIKIIYNGGNYIQPQLAYRIFKKMVSSEGLSLKTKEPAPHELSHRQTEILKLIAQGMPNKEIAEALIISEKTVKAHLRSIFRRLEISNRAQAVIYAIKYNII
jgi:two-component system, NarL family, response regulator DegU